MKVLIACEFSGIMRQAFAKRGHDAWSCDLLPTEQPGQHVVGDVMLILDQGWDLMIAHPSCTYLCNSGVRWLSDGKVLNQERHKQMIDACCFFGSLYWANIPKICLENPIMHKHARDFLRDKWRVPSFTQSVQPWQFGHGETKRTCLWLRGLPKLVEPASRDIELGEFVENPDKVHRTAPGENRWRERSRSYPGMAKAMAEQWG